LKHIKLIFSFVLIILIAGSAYAENKGIGFGLHAGYGVTSYEEDTDAFGRDTESEATLDTVIVGASVEYT
jgi:hypothetical protein